MIVKLQRSVMTSHLNPQLLIYDKKHSFAHEQDMTQALSNFMGDRLKVYAKAHIGKNKMLMIDKIVEDQNW